MSTPILFITGASRGIGKAIALKMAAGGARIAIASKTETPHPKLDGTIYTAAEEIERAGGQALPLVCDIRDEAQINAAVEATVAKFGGIDILVNNASAISLSKTPQTEAKRFDLMHQVNVRGTFLVSKACIPHLARSSNPHILTLAPPLNLDPRWLGAHLAYTLSKFGMSMVAMGLASELAPEGIASNTLWPRTTIATAAVLNLLGGEALASMSRTPSIVADAAALIFSRPARTFTGQHLIDEDLLRESGLTDFTSYAVDPSKPLAPDIFL
ncbi:SDR family oxidoreductase [Dinghuibacter silviterrae]|uniref:Citronellol/citronellal dehydrogenase n=1 Tax=Dinghuibacter silviterrae TaxID=1539049 RepID=A0A4R8DRU8_9BACT|nr:NAD(P)-dependent oxidoreductase [Dinghuibacter silviterrae]TDW99870.1 citronellol/citronellal dehydrogenase [Dinghuibacter silviterrae]